MIPELLYLPDPQFNALVSEQERTEALIANLKHSVISKAELYRNYSKPLLLTISLINTKGAYKIVSLSSLLEKEPNSSTMSFKFRIFCLIFMTAIFCKSGRTLSNVFALNPDSLQIPDSILC